MLFLSKFILIFLKDLDLLLFLLPELLNDLLLGFELLVVVNDLDVLVLKLLDRLHGIIILFVHPIVIDLETFFRLNTGVDVNVNLDPLVIDFRVCLA